jgi:hypothetical protein
VLLAVDGGPHLTSTGTHPPSSVNEHFVGLGVAFGSGVTYETTCPQSSFTARVGGDVAGAVEPLAARLVRRRRVMSTEFFPDSRGGCEGRASGIRPVRHPELGLANHGAAGGAGGIGAPGRALVVLPMGGRCGSTMSASPSFGRPNRVIFDGQLPLPA